MQKNKRGISLMVSYVLLVVIAIALGALVYSYLKHYLPSDKAECSDDISITATEVSCDRRSDTASLSVKLYNSGLFNISGVYLRFADAGKSVRLQIPANKGHELFFQPLSPGGLSRQTLPVTDLIDSSSEDYILEIQPAIFSDRTLIPCQNAVITQPVTCIEPP